MANPLDAYVTSRPGSFPRDFKVPPVPSLKTSMAGKSPADGQASHDAQMEQWRKNLENSIAERMREPAAATSTTTSTASATTPTAQDVTSVNGQTGDVTLSSDDVAQGTTNLYLTKPAWLSFFDSLGFHKNTVDLGEEVIIPAARNLVMVGPLAIDGVMIVDGYFSNEAPKVTPLGGSVILGIGVSSGTISGLSLPFVPSAVIPIVSKPSGGLNIFANPIEKSLSAAGFSFDLSGTTDSTSYRLVFLFLP